MTLAGAAAAAAAANTHLRSRKSGNRRVSVDPGPVLDPGDASGSVRTQNTVFVVAGVFGSSWGHVQERLVYFGVRVDRSTGPDAGNAPARGSDNPR